MPCDASRHRHVLDEGLKLGKLNGSQAKLVGQEGKLESYYFPPQYNPVDNSFPHTYFGLERWEEGKNGILDLSKAYRLRPGTSWLGNRPQSQFNNTSFLGLRLSPPITTSRPSVLNHEPIFSSSRTTQPEGNSARLRSLPQIRTRRWNQFTIECRSSCNAMITIIGWKRANRSIAARTDPPRTLFDTASKHAVEGITYVCSPRN